MRKNQEVIELSVDGYKSISEAPMGPEALPAWSLIDDPMARDKFTDNFRKNEATKLYACCDKKGNIFLIQNPICWEWVKIRDGVWKRIRPAPQPYLQISELNEVKAVKKQLSLEF